MIRPSDDPSHPDLEAVVDVRDEEELEQALERLDPEIFLLRGHEPDEDVDPLDAVLELLPDVPAGKLAIAHVEVATRDEVLALERAGIDAVLVVRRARCRARRRTRRSTCRRGYHGARVRGLPHDLPAPGRRARPRAGCGSDAQEG